MITKPVPALLSTPTDDSPANPHHPGTCSRPVNLRDQFKSTAAFAEGDDPARWARRTSALLDLIGNPTRVLSALGKAEHRQV
ncbi:hypothetical protein OHB41_09700 [Streptomyces sp. NBC_01571]|uniref:hypothetical protein n=1 Tax=Streptomyces sp. NBC_01571 TaxID=2975883 RepID=UPI00225C0D5F|nr:hypothetical protein [Streptomyces sp. NBC_01571]MCX4573451.1 hypothetical protein [Streptomyces sp. NBC_01571]